MAEATAVTRIEVRPAADPPYVVQIGDRPARVSSSTLSGGATRVAVLHPRALLATAEALARRAPGVTGHPEVHLLEVPDGEAGEGPGRRGLRLDRAGPGRIHPRRSRHRPRRRSRDRPCRLRRRDLAARGTRRAGADHAAGDGRRGRRRQDRHQHRGGQEPGRRVPPAVRGVLRSGDARDAAARRVHRRARRGGQDRASSPTRSSSTCSRPTPPVAPSLRELIERSVAVKAEVVSADPKESGPPRDPQLRPHPRPRHRARRALPVASWRRRLGRAGLRRRRFRGVRPGSTTRPPTATASCSTASAFR